MFSIYNICILHSRCIGDAHRLCVLPLPPLGGSATLGSGRLPDPRAVGGMRDAWEEPPGGDGGGGVGAGGAERGAARRGPNWEALAPVLYAPLLPLRETPPNPTLTPGLPCPHLLSANSTVALKPLACRSADPESISVRLGLRGRVAPVTRDRIFGGAVLVALGHAGWVMSRDGTLIGD